MGFYDLYRARMNGNNTDSEVKQDEISQAIKDNFYAQPNYHQVYLNNDLVTQYDVLISEGNVKDKTVGYKILTSYPYATYVFDSGDYITYTYGGETTTWLLTSIEKGYLYNVKGRIERCNNDLKWIDSNGETQSYKCVIQDSIKEDGTKDTKKIRIPDGYILVEVQSDANTSLIAESKRFLFNGKAFKVRSIINFVDTNTIAFAMEQDLVNDDFDDVVNNIANDDIYDYQISINQSDFEQIVTYTDTLTYTLQLNNEDVVKDIEWVSSDTDIATINASGEIELLTEGSVTFTVRLSDNNDISDDITVTVVATPSSTAENRISPNVTEILQGLTGETQVYTVYKYIDNVANSDTFTITDSGAHDDYYTFTVLGDNSFSVTSLGYTSTKLTVTCVNDTDATSTNIEIQLKGLW